MKTLEPSKTQPRAWWREPMMWLVVGGPAAVILAGVATLVLAVSRPDPVVDPDYYRRGLEINKTMAERQAAASEAPAVRPALEVRNHAATGGTPGR
ncbi:FixH family protein [Caldimonas aquatica]|uniref:FixH family protein n=1 Tax=Caldimonas aquatica TaxID=376175 RepID=A0ABY6MMX5_9BURK|nr:FixH family protein [Schlegelella aquatica]UZD53866.1 FixH family protein [Schlegelella aquatica]